MDGLPEVHSGVIFLLTSPKVGSSGGLVWFGFPFFLIAFIAKMVLVHLQVLLSLTSFWPSFQNAAKEEGWFSDPCADFLLQDKLSSAMQSKAGKRWKSYFSTRNELWLMNYFACHFSIDVDNFRERFYRKKARENRQLTYLVCRCLWMSSSRQYWSCSISVITFLIGNVRTEGKTEGKKKKHIQWAKLVLPH